MRMSPQLNAQKKQVAQQPPALALRVQYEALREQEKKIVTTLLSYLSMVALLDLPWRLYKFFVPPKPSSALFVARLAERSNEIAKSVSTASSQFDNTLAVLCANLLKNPLRPSRQETDGLMYFAQQMYRILTTPNHSQRAELVNLMTKYELGTPYNIASWISALSKAVFNPPANQDFYANLHAFFNWLMEFAEKNSELSIPNLMEFIACRAAPLKAIMFADALGTADEITRAFLPLPNVINHVLALGKKHPGFFLIGPLGLIATPFLLELLFEKLFLKAIRLYSRYGLLIPQDERELATLESLPATAQKPVATALTIASQRLKIAPRYQVTGIIITTITTVAAIATAELYEVALLAGAITATYFGQPIINAATRLGSRIKNWFTKQVSRVWQHLDYQQSLAQLIKALHYAEAPFQIYGTENSDRVYRLIIRVQDGQQADAIISHFLARNHIVAECMGGCLYVEPQSFKHLKLADVIKEAVAAEQQLTKSATLLKAQIRKYLQSSGQAPAFKIKYDWDNHCCWVKIAHPQIAAQKEAWLAAFNNAEEFFLDGSKPTKLANTLSVKITLHTTQLSNLNTYLKQAIPAPQQGNFVMQPVLFAPSELEEERDDHCSDDSMPAQHSEEEAVLTSIDSRDGSTLYAVDSPFHPRGRCWAKLLLGSRSAALPEIADFYNERVSGERLALVSNVNHQGIAPLTSPMTVATADGRMLANVEYKTLGTYANTRLFGYTEKTPENGAIYVLKAIGPALH